MLFAQCFNQSLDSLLVIDCASKTVSHMNQMSRELFGQHLEDGHDGEGGVDVSHIFPALGSNLKQQLISMYHHCKNKSVKLFALVSGVMVTLKAMVSKISEDAFLLRVIEDNTKVQSNDSSAAAAQTLLDGRSVDAMIIFHSCTNIIVKANHTAFALFGDRLHLRRPVWETLGGKPEEGKIIEMEPGTGLVVEVSCSLLGNSELQLCIVRDISKRKRKISEAFQSISSQKQLLDQALDGMVNQHQLWEATVNASTDAIIQMNIEGIILRANKAAHAMFVYEEGELPGKEVIELMTKDDAAYHQQFVQRSVEGEFQKLKMNKRQEFIAKRRDETTFPIEVTIVEVVKNGTRVFTSFIRDLTARREAEKEKRERAQSDFLLSHILPSDIADRLKLHPSEMIADDNPNSVVLFCDIVGFTTLCEAQDARFVIELLNGMFSAWDMLMEGFPGLLKVKTIGDAYMVVGLNGDEKAKEIVEFAQCMIEASQVPVRIGIANGPVISGVIGLRTKAYDVWGSTVNTAARMESAGVPGHIQVSEGIVRLLSGYPHFKFEEREVKLKGLAIKKAYLLL